MSDVVLVRAPACLHVPQNSAFGADRGRRASPGLPLPAHALPLHHRDAEVRRGGSACLSPRALTRVQEARPAAAEQGARRAAVAPPRCAAHERRCGAVQIDLVPRAAVDEWLDYFHAHYPKVPHPLQPPTPASPAPHRALAAFRSVLYVVSARRNRHGGERRRGTCTIPRSQTLIAAAGAALKATAPGSALPAVCRRAREAGAQVRRGKVPVGAAELLKCCRAIVEGTCRP
jgi:hypothetical protein